MKLYGCASTFCVASNLMLCFANRVYVYVFYVFTTTPQLDTTVESVTVRERESKTKCLTESIHPVEPGVQLTYQDALPPPRMTPITILISCCLRPRSSLATIFVPVCRYFVCIYVYMCVCLCHSLQMCTYCLASCCLSFASVSM